MRKIISSFILFACVLSSVFCASITEVPAEHSTSSIRILATSDMHGFFAPYDYFANKESLAGSVAQVATLVKERRTENTIVVDAGDIIQDNSADFFVGKGVHPMVKAMNAVGYDAWVTGNHEYNYGMDNLKKMICDMNAPLLLGNVSKDGELLGNPYIIIDRGGIRIALIGMTTPNIVYWDNVNLKGWDVTDPVTQLRRCIDEVKDKADILVAVLHMGLENELETPNSGCIDVANACPELDLIVSSHDHGVIAGQEINGVKIVQNKNHAETVAQIDFDLEYEGGKWNIVDIRTESIPVASYEPDQGVLDITGDDDIAVKEEAAKPIGVIEGGSLIEKGSASGLCTVALYDSAWMHFIADMEFYFSGADVAVTFATMSDNSLEEGSLTNSSVSLIYLYNNNLLYKVKMTGRQLKTFMEWSATFYNTFEEGDLTVSYNPSVRFYNHDFFYGVRYDVNVSKPVGSRIENLTWLDGTPVDENQEITVAVSDYRAKSMLTVPGVIFDADDLPTIVEVDVGGEIGGFQQLISYYIKNVLDGVVIPSEEKTWQLTGIVRDEDKYEKALQLIAEGKLSVKMSDDGRTPNVVPITVADVDRF